MPTLIVENVPVDVYERIRERAAAQQRTLPEETLYLLEKGLRQEEKPNPRLPEFIPSEEISSPCDLPRSSRPVRVLAYEGQLRLPDVLADLDNSLLTALSPDTMRLPLPK